MPDKAKRRNKNKNKRKNKNNRPDNTNIRDAKENVTELCNIQSDINKNCDNEAASVSESSAVTFDSDIPHFSEIACDTPNARSDNQDLNNNRSSTSTTQALSNLVQTLAVPPPIEDYSATNIVEADVEEVNSQETDSYIVESPEQTTKSSSSKSKLSITFKSKSLDNDDEPKIVELTEDISTQIAEENNAMAVIDTSNILISDVESDVEWEKTDELHGIKVPTPKDKATGTVSITAIPFDVAECNQTKPLTPEMEISLRNYLKTLDLSTHPENIESVEIKAEIEQIINREIKQRLRKKCLSEDFGMQRLGAPRMLDVIDEEGSSESSITSRRQSYLSEKKSDVEDLEDDVFEDSKKISAITHRVASSFPKQTFGRLVPQQCVLVGAKIKDPEITEARGNWTMSTIEKITGAEVVYLTDSSSSTSSLHDNDDDVDDGADTDVSIRMITPTIEVTDTENLLKRTFMPDSKDVVSTISNDANSVASSQKDDAVSVKETCEKQESPKLDYNIEETDSSEIIVLSTDDLKTNLYVKDIENKEVINGDSHIEKSKYNNIHGLDSKFNSNYDLEMKVLKCELNDAINNLIKEVSDSEINENVCSNVFARQDSSSSVCSSQCTAKYNPSHSSLNDVSNFMHDEVSDNKKLVVDNIDKNTSASHVKDVIDHVPGTSTQSKEIIGNNNAPSLLRDICVRRIAKFPYGDKILEELASVSKRLQNIASHGIVTSENSSFVDCKDIPSRDANMPYFPLPNLSSIEKIILPSKSKDSVPPPVQPRHSSLKREKSREDDVWTGIPTKTEPVYVCLSPSQKMLMEKTHTILPKDDASDLVNTHIKFVDRRGYNEYYRKENHKNESGVDITPIIPFKSQTGSRLLALIRDPTLTSSINSINKHCSSDIFESKISAPQTYLATSSSNIGGSSDTFRPIPPPRPKKMSAFYESDESSDFTDSSIRSMKNERKFFHYSTGNLSKEIEDDVSSIQQMHRNYTNTRDRLNGDRPRRPSLPKDLCDQQMEYIRQKEKEVEAEIRRLEAQSSKMPSKSVNAPTLSEKEYLESKNVFISKQRDFTTSIQKLGKIEKPEKGKLHSVFSKSQEELLREKMYSEYVTQMAERQERKQHKVIKITNTSAAPSNKVSKSMPVLDVLDSKVNNRIEKEFICKARERWDKLGIKDPETEDERDKGDVYREPKVIEHKIKVIEGNKESEMGNLPRHLQEFVSFTAKDKEKADSLGESDSKPASPHVIILCAVIIIFLAVGRYFLRLLRNI